ncbi:MAG: DUF4956 domain-containing protein [Kiritimatiellaeota bacterium]|nr:DUF4956 domain-containing protein [Kiritimatiellota bacterium]
MASPEKILKATETVGVIREMMSDPGVYATALLVSLAAAFAASLMYRFFYERRGTGSQAHRSFPLLALSVTTLFIVVQISLPLSLGLLGSLSIVRFRVPIKEPEEIGFVLLVIAASITAATGHYVFMAILYAFALVAMLAARGAGMWKLLKRDGIIVLTFKQPPDAAPVDPDSALAPFFNRIVLESSSCRDGVGSYQYVFSGLKTTASDLQQRLAGKLPLQSANIFLDRPGGIR